MSEPTTACANCPNGQTCTRKAANKEPSVIRLVPRSMASPVTYNPHSRSLAPELGRAYAAQCQAPTADGEAKLRDITIALVSRLKEDGLPPERVVVAVKTAIARYGHSGVAPSLANGEDRCVPSHPVYAKIFRWLLDAFFAGVDAAVTRG